MIHLMLAEEDKSAIMSFFDRWGNAASVVGLGIALIGFIATLWSIWRIKTYTRNVVGKIGVQLLSAEIAVLLRLISEARNAGREEQWPRAIDRCDEARLIAIRLCRSPHLLQDEQDAIRRLGDDLRVVVVYIENNRLRPGAGTGNLPNDKKRALDLMVTTVGGIQARLHGSAMEV
jgi:hypothetical protein